MDNIGVGESDKMRAELPTRSSSADNKVTLSWKTATEVNNHGFEVERTQMNTTKWEKISFVQGHVNSNSQKEYSFIDKPFMIYLGEKNCVS
ncbi:MAG: hypothetical protein HY963_03155 [Ignavibacteriales bacterium]|nr:hypothetical protein [Ignavibacteriales bacterium]